VFIIIFLFFYFFVFYINCLFFVILFCFYIFLFCFGFIFFYFVLFFFLFFICLISKICGYLNKRFSEKQSWELVEQKCYAWIKKEALKLNASQFDWPTLAHGLAEKLLQ
jgi:hypothetical protein